MKVTKIHILLFLFFSASCFSVEFETIELPVFMSGVKDDISQSGNYYTYPGGVHLNKTPDPGSDDEVEAFVANLWKIYRSDDLQSFKALFTAKARLKLKSLGDEVIKREWDILAKQKQSLIKSYFKIKDGIVTSWMAGTIPRGLFLKRVGSDLKIDEFEADSDDVGFHNRSLYFTYLPKKEKAAKIVKKFKLSDKDYNLVVETKQTYLHLFKKENGKWEPKVVIKDNDVGKGRFDDNNPKKGIISLNFEREHFTQGVEHELLVLQSNFPMAYYPLSLAPSGNLFLKK
ncbi:MAG: hypothetical protein KC478_04300 [Bacteriovoracaceae bacterium]|nr:hypothetical protein [Bacteriovoracaceae bacterium]